MISEKLLKLAVTFTSGGITGFFCAQDQSYVYSESRLRVYGLRAHKKKPGALPDSHKLTAGMKLKISNSCIALNLLLLLIPKQHAAQSNWPSESWDDAENLTAAMDTLGLVELSGLYWNPLTNRLYVLNNIGGLRVMELDTGSGTFMQIANASFAGGPEGITLADDSADEFYVIDENSYRIIRYSHAADFSNISEVRSWNLLSHPSPMTNTANFGPEGIAFIPDSFLTVSGFVSEASGQPYTSSKGLGGLMFIAHQNQGYVWAFDINPDMTDDFAFAGKYRTNSTESCDLAFDRSTGLLYVLHNAAQNTLEVVSLSIDSSGSEMKLTTINEYAVPNPAGNINIEGFAITPKCADTSDVSAWLCRDVTSMEILYQTDCIRWFNPFQADGDCPDVNTVSAEMATSAEIELFWNHPSGLLMINSDEIIRSYIVCNSMGSVMEKKVACALSLEINTQAYSNGIYYVAVQSAMHNSIHKFLVMR